MSQEFTIREWEERVAQATCDRQDISKHLK